MAAPVNDIDGKVLHVDLLNPKVKEVQYAVRGELYLRGQELKAEGREIIATNSECGRARWRPGAALDDRRFSGKGARRIGPWFWGSGVADRLVGPLCGRLGMVVGIWSPSVASARRGGEIWVGWARWVVRGICVHWWGQGVGRGG